MESRLTQNTNDLCIEVSNLPHVGYDGIGGSACEETQRRCCVTFSLPRPVVFEGLLQFEVCEGQVFNVVDEGLRHRVD